MRKIYWSLPALLLAGAAAWGQGILQSDPEPQRADDLTLTEHPRSQAAQLLAEARQALKSGNVTLARQLLEQAEKLKVEYGSFDDSPDTLRDDLTTEPTVQVFPAATRTIHSELQGNVLLDSGVVPPTGTMGAPGIMNSGGLRGPMKAKQVQRMFVETQYLPLSDFEIREKHSFEEALRALQSDDPKSDKTAALKAVHELLSVGFERDLETRESELKQLETRVQKLRSQLDKRKAAKQEIIDLRLKTIQNEADGLEYPGAATPPSETPNPLVPEPAAAF